MQSRLSVQIMSEHQGAWPLIWSQTHQDTKGEMCQPPALIQTSWSGDQSGVCAATLETSAHWTSSAVFPGRLSHLAITSGEHWLFRPSCQKGLVRVQKPRRKNTQMLQMNKTRANGQRSNCNQVIFNTTKILQKSVCFIYDTCKTKTASGSFSSGASTLR